MKKTLRIILTLLLCAAARQGYCANTSGTGAVPFLKLPVEARGAGMGEAVAGAASGPMALFQNPAGLVSNKTVAFSFSHSLLVEDISYDVLGLALPLKSGGVIGVGAQYLQYGSMKSLDNTGAPAGTLSPKDSAFAAGYGLSLGEDVMAGATAKYISSKISGLAATSALDFGLLMYDESFSMGFTAQNMGKGLKFNKEESPLPVNLRFGVNVHYVENWNFAADFNFPKDGTAWAAAGAEYAFARKGAWKLIGRAGYNTSAADTKGVNGLSAGFGLALNSLSCDYAFRTMGLLGTTHHLGLTYRLGK
ncbi:MAG: PorV/PorQ family protein [Elusimicrobia bacterium]|nr:PorV/PorQ family protein [Elusimicrobiota bacterium]